jgi:uncharacterized protein YigE (DUF2233 family)
MHLRHSLPVLAALALLAMFGSASADDGPCRPFAYGGKSFIICTADLRRDAIRLFWKGADGGALGSFARLRQTPEGSRLAFAMNAGMYRPDLSPAGLYIENGRELKRANTANGPGNFHMKPNGVFFVDKDGAGVTETSRYLKLRAQASFRPDLATQSGPMLVIAGRIHPRISETGTSAKIRNGVGVQDSQTVTFAISDEPVTFGEFAHLFRDGLHCPDALFLDGGISTLYAPSLGRTDNLWPLGPIVGVLPRE